MILGVGMMALLLQVNRHIREQMENNVRGVDMVVGAKGSPLQLILSAVFHIDSPTGNVPLREVETLNRNPLVASCIPLSYGDSYQGYRIVGTNHEYVDLFEASLEKGKLWEKPFEVTLGAGIAEKLKLKIGDGFVGTHGLTKGIDTHDEHPYTVVGVLEFTNSVIDQLILTATESVWETHHDHDDETDKHKHQNDNDDYRAHDEAHDHEEETDEHEHHDEHHDHNDHGEEHEQEVEERYHEETNEHEHHDDHNEGHEEEEREVTAILVKFRSPVGLIQIPRRINEETNMQAAVPIYEISRLFRLLGVGVTTMNTIALVIIIVSGLSIFISLFNAMKERQYEMALMRTYGASRWKLVRLVVQESLILVIAGFVFGMLSARVGLWSVSELMESNYHYSFMDGALIREEIWLLVTILLIGFIASVLPAIRVFYMDISKVLADD